MRRPAQRLRVRDFMRDYAANAVARAVYEAGSRGWTLQHSCIRYRQAADRGIDKWEFACDDKSQRISVHGPVIVNGAEVAVRAARRKRGRVRAHGGWARRLAGLYTAMHFERGREPMTALPYYAQGAEAALLNLCPAQCMTLIERA